MYGQVGGHILVIQTMQEKLFARILKMRGNVFYLHTYFFLLLTLIKQQKTCSHFEFHGVCTNKKQAKPIHIFIWVLMKE